MLKFPLDVYDKQLTLYDKELVEFCAEYLPQHGEVLPFQEFPNFRKLGMKEVNRAYGHLFYLGLMKKRDADSVIVSTDVYELMSAWKNPPPRDYRDLATKWFWSKPWSIALYALVVLLPAVLGWVWIVRAAVAWLRRTQ
jgi:hypothetical protein